MALNEQRHRHNTEAALLDADAKAVKRGHWLGFAASAVCIIACLASIAMGAHWSVSIALVGLPIMSMIGQTFGRK
jgi:uncharacterized membrane protein